MRIGEIAEKTGLSISNIRFYEKKGLIGPGREEESKYRNYTEADLERLNLIILYRKMDISVEVIGKILEKQISVEDALEQQLIDLKEKQQMLQSSLDLCQKMIDDRAYEEIDVNHYLDYVKEEETNGKIFGKIDDLLEDFVDFTRVNPYVLGMLPLVTIFPKRWMYGVLMVVWMAFLIIFPIVGIVLDIVDGNGVGFNVIGLCVTCLILAIPFISFRREWKR